MVEILDAAAQILCPTPDSFNTCQQFINEFAYQGPVQQLLFFLFFPTVFIILFVFILTRTLPFLGGGAQGDRAHQGLRLLLSLAFYAFIIVQGWYSIALVLSRFWFVVIIVLAGLIYFVRGHFGGQGGGPGHMPGVSSRKFGPKEILLGSKVINPGDWEGHKRLYDERLREFRDAIEKRKGELNDPKISEREKAMIREDVSTFQIKISRLESRKKQRLPFIEDY